MTGDTTLRASGQKTTVYFVNVSNDGTGAGTAGHIIIENGAGTDLIRIPFASTQHQSLFVSFNPPLEIDSGLIVNYVTVTKALVDIGWDG
jgi:hypothetical protein